MAQKGEFPLFIHDLLTLAKRSSIEFAQEDKKKLAEINTFNINARYDDYKKEFYKKATQEYTQKWIHETELIITHISKLV